MISLTEGSIPFTAIYEAEGVIREEDFTARDFTGVAELLLAGVRFDKVAVGVWHRHVFYRWMGKGAGVTGTGFVSEPEAGRPGHAMPDPHG